MTTGNDNSRLVHAQFRRIAALSPDGPALRFRGASGWTTWTYVELAGRSNALARTLVSLGIGPGDAVGVDTRRHPDTVAALIGILSAGACYVPLNPEYPSSRLGLMCADVSVRMILAPGQFPVVDGVAAETRSVEELLAGGPADASAPLPVDLSAEDAAYIIFTSGSTGLPKAVVVPHRGILHLLTGTPFMSLSSQTVFMQIAALSFDPSTLEIWGPLLHGGVCVLYPDDQLPNPSGLKAAIAETGINCLHLTTSLFHNAVNLDVSAFAGLEYLVVGGEAMSVPHAAKVMLAFPALKLVNAYGPTENSVITTSYAVPRDFSETARGVPIGTPVSGTRVLVVDGELNPVSKGDEGELLALGDGLALGYANKPELTAERFITVTTPAGETLRAYRTGDRVREGNDGVLEFLGRFDDQVKIDGHRIEPGEIEQVVYAVSSVRECRVLVRKSPTGQKRIVTYVTTNDGENEHSLRQKLSDRLPSFMVPHFFVFLDQFPTNVNGKLDISALPDPLAEAASRGGINTMPVDGQDVVRSAWARVLGRLPESADVNFFDAGGTSLDAMQLHELLQQKTDKTLASTFVFEHPTIVRQLKELSATVKQDPADVGRGALRRAARARQNQSWR